MRIRVVLISTALTCGIAAQSLRQVDSLPSMRADVRLVLVPVTVTDRRSATVNGIMQQHFTLMEDNRPQNIVSFVSQDAPCSIGVVIDTSGSMLPYLASAKAAVRAFLATNEARDEAFLINVSDRPELRSEFTPDAVLVQDRMTAIVPGGNTALVDTLYLALGRIRSARNSRKALLVISDGMDNHSRYSKHELLSAAMETDVQIFAISIGAPPPNKKLIQQMEEEQGLLFLRELAEKTGGVYFQAAFESDVQSAVTRAGRAMRDQYLIAYQPPATQQPGKWHKIRVKLDVPTMSVHTRNGYYSPEPSLP